MLPRWQSGKESTCQCRRRKRQGLDPWVGKIPWRRKWQRTPVSLLGKSHGQRSLMGYSHGVAKSQTRLSTHRDEHTQSGDFPGGVQWLKFCPSTAVGCGLKYLVGELRSCILYFLNCKILSFSLSLSLSVADAILLRESLDPTGAGCMGSQKSQTRLSD